MDISGANLMSLLDRAAYLAHLVKVHQDYYILMGS